MGTRLESRAMTALLGFAGATFAALLPIANPLGGAPVFAALTADDDESTRRRQAIRTSLYVFGILATFLLAGRPILEFFGISVGVLRIAGGLIVAHTAWGMVNGTSRITPDEHAHGVAKDDVSFTPMAMPLIAGPGAIGVVIGIATASHGWEHLAGAVAGIAALSIVLLVCLLAGEGVLERLGASGLGALTRILGFLILAIAVQLVVAGIYSVTGHPAPGAFGP
jgi:multiple antibiotic resistance protein